MAEDASKAGELMLHWEEFKKLYKLNDAQAMGCLGDIRILASAANAKPALEMLVNVLISANSNTNPEYNPVHSVLSMTKVLSSAVMRQEAPSMDKLWQKAREISDRISNPALYIETILNTSAYLRS